MAPPIEKIKNGLVNDKSDVKVAEEKMDYQALILAKLKNGSIFTSSITGTKDSSKVDQAEQAYKSAQVQYTLADMNIFHEEAKFNSVIASGKLMA